MEKEYICTCGQILKKEIKPDLKPNGIVLKYPVWVCTNCDQKFDEDEVKELEYEHANS